MKRFYLRFRIMLMTFALGLASVFVFGGSLKYSDEIYVDLPKLQTEKIIIVSPAYDVETPENRPRAVYCTRGSDNYKIQKAIKSRKSRK